MFKRALTKSDFLLIVVNLIPLYGVWFEDWDPKQIFLVYCLETVIIGLVNIIKMACVTIFVKPRDVWENGGSTTMQSGWFFIFFFIMHYGFFVFVQTQLFFGVTGMIPDGSMLMRYSKIPGLLGPNGRLLLLIFIAYYTVQSLFSFFNSGKYKTISMGRLMFEPYLRIIVQQVVVILGSMFLTFGAGKVFILIFIVVKIFFDVYINLDRYMEVAEKRQKLREERKQNN